LNDIEIIAKSYTHIKVNAGSHDGTISENKQKLSFDQKRYFIKKKV